MTKQIPEFLEYFLYDVLEGNSRISYKKLFSGFAIYFEGKIFAMYVTKRLFFKEIPKNKEFFDKYNAPYFEYARKDKKRIRLKYREAPEEFLENKDLLWDIILEIASIQ